MSFSSSLDRHSSVATPGTTDGAIPERLWLLIFLTVAAIWFVGLGWRPLLSPDEGRYAEIAREMAVSNDFVTPRLNDLKYFEKPPLHYWLGAVAFKAFGESEAVARLVPALYGFGIGLAVYLCLLWLRDRATAQQGFLLAIGTCWIAAMGHFIALDIGLTFWLTLSVCGLLGCIERVDMRDNTARRHRWPDYWVWIGMAGGFLSKGLIAGVIPAAAMGLCIMLSFRWRLITAVRWFPGVLVFAALVLPWLVAVQMANPGFFEFFFIREHFQRFTTKMHQRVEPWWFFIPVFLMGGLPWLGLWLARLRRRLNSGDLMLLAWVSFTVLFFSASGSKLPSYILPIFPALALWLARAGSDLSPRSLKLATIAPIIGAALLLGVAIKLNTAPVSGDPLAADHLYVPWIAAAATAMLIGVAVSWRLVNRGFTAYLTPLAIGMLLATQCLQWGHGVMNERFSSQGLAARFQASEREFGPATPFFCVGTYDQTLPFYLKRSLTLVGFRDEMDMGLSDEPNKNGPTESQLRQDWSKMPQAYALLDLKQHESWRRAGVPMREVSRNARRVIVANR